MALTQAIKGNIEASMGRVRLRKVLAIVLGAGLVFVVAGAVIFGVAIQPRMAAPPELDVRFGRSQLVAYTTHTPECARYLTPCPPELIDSPAQDFYVVWVLTQSRPPTPPDEREEGKRLLVVSLMN